MSLRFLYRKIPVNKRICNYYRCQKPILRNIAEDKDGRIYHWGCLQSARDERFRCLNCYAIFDATEVALDFQFGKLTLLCPHCGSFNLRRLHNHGLGRLE